MKHIVVFIFVACLLSSCANIIPPSGGDKDTIAPQASLTIPENGSVNVTGNQIELEFSEEVDATKLESELNIVPHYKGELKIIARKKNVIIRFLEPLEQNTTYTLNFGNGITDITERNVAKGLSYSFSTGPTIDSLTYRGSIKWLPVNSSNTKVIIGLYPAADTASPFTSKPYYYTYAGSTNIFYFHHLKEGEYKVYAWLDKNDNETLDPETETAGYRNQNLILRENVKQDSIVIFPPKNILPAVLSTRYLSSYNLVKLNKPVADFEILDQNKSVINSFGITKKEILFYSNGTLKDTIKLNLSLTDTSGQKNIQLVSLYFDENYPGEREIKSVSKNPLVAQIQYVDDKPKLTIRTDNPIISIDTQIVTIQQKGKNVNWSVTDSKVDYKNKTLIINNLSLIYGDTVLITFINNSNPRPYNNKLDTLRSKQLVLDRSMLSGLGMRINTSEKNYIIQIINREGEIVVSEVNPQAMKFRSFMPGVYKVRAIIDTNANGIWDTGDVINHVEPENILYYKETINLKANWEIWDIQFNF